MGAGLGSTKHHQPMSHAEISQIVQALQQPNPSSWELSECKLFITGMLLTSGAHELIARVFCCTFVWCLQVWLLQSGGRKSNCP